MKKHIFFSRLFIIFALWQGVVVGLSAAQRDDFGGFKKGFLNGQGEDEKKPPKRSTEYSFVFPSKKKKFTTEYSFSFPSKKKRERQENGNGRINPHFVFDPGDDVVRPKKEIPSLGWEILQSEGLDAEVEIEDSERVSLIEAHRVGYEATALRVLKELEIDQAKCFYRKISHDAVVFQVPFPMQQQAFCASYMCLGSQIFGTARNLNEFFTDLIFGRISKQIEDVKRRLGNWADTYKVIPLLTGCNNNDITKTSFLIKEAKKIFVQDIHRSLLMLPSLDYTSFFYEGMPEDEKKKIRERVILQVAKTLRDSLTNVDMLNLRDSNGRLSTPLIRFKTSDDKPAPEIFLAYSGDPIKGMGHWFAIRVERMPNGMIAILFADSLSWHQGIFVNKIGFYEKLFLELARVFNGR